MANRLGDAISPYLRSHAGNPVDWFPWGEEAFAEARRRDVPVLVSIGYSTCHWCHVMARESFSDPALAAQLNAGFVAIKVDREEHPEVDAVYLAAAGAFTQNLGWPLNVFVTPDARPFFAGTYSPPVPVQSNPSFGQVLAAVGEAWTQRRDDVESTAAQLSAALASAGDATGDAATGDAAPDAASTALPTRDQLAQVVFELDAYEDEVHGGFGGAPKFPVAPVLKFLLTMDAPVAVRTLRAIAASDLRDPVEGGFFRYATRADWSEPHYERMLYDNALLLEAYATVAARVPHTGAADGAAAATREGAVQPETAGPGSAADDSSWALDAAEGIARFLLDTLWLGTGFGSAQDSESTVAGARSEGGYYLLDAAGRAAEVAPAVDRKVLTGWNGLAIRALALAGDALGREDWVVAARRAADALLANHRRPGGLLVRVSLDGRISAASATAEDYGMLADALLVLAAVTGEQGYADAGRELVDLSIVGGRFVAPGGGDPVLAARGLLVEGDVSEGAYPSGASSLASATYRLHRSGLTPTRAIADTYLDVVLATLAPIVDDALTRPIGFGASLEVVARIVADRN